jgi:hypothetical protein
VLIRDWDVEKSQRRAWKWKKVKRTVHAIENMVAWRNQKKNCFSQGPLGLPQSQKANPIRSPIQLNACPSSKLILLNICDIHSWITGAIEACIIITMRIEACSMSMSDILASGHYEGMSHILALIC